ncbi:alpha/beta hydrolase family protein [Chthonomonas calidirosea]|uniref:alpha/beta hydrolase family protein n=1 Tax=Chthonomonas calidirosea TaxID=454171 RepID=UPI0006ECCB6F|nr:alpha/beta hydrolase family protein [Chthonomonas calidirosea]CEK15465.1 dienelactone hydrolase-like enzyme [Chthonomonas calidirosea]
MIKRNLPFVPPLSCPPTLAEWQEQRERIKQTLLSLLGDLPPKSTPEVEQLECGQREGVRFERFRFHNGDPLGGEGAIVTGYLLFPQQLDRPAPAIQYLHWHGGEYDVGKEQLWRRGARGTSIAQELVSRGYVVLAIDAYGFGERAGTGPDGPEERGGQEEASWAKLNLWYGRTLWGMMLRDEQLALDYLLTRPEVDGQRVAAMGMSMGSTRAWWHMAVDERVRCGIGIACLTRYQNLIQTGALATHGIYFFVPNFLRHFDTEAVVALCAPRPLLLLNGELDRSTPVSGVEAINAAVEPIYALYEQPANYRSLVYPNIGHEWTPAMWEELFQWLEMHL